MDKSKTQYSTEQMILNAARTVFIRNGLEGARMQQIADEAGINKALLHYYFRSKERLFDQIFETALNEVFDVINHCITDTGDVFIFIENFVDHYLTLIKKNPFIPNFIFNEITNHPERMEQFSRQFKINVSGFERMVERNIALQRMIPIKAEHLMIDLLGLCVFPYVARPMIKEIFFKNHPTDIENFLSERKQHIIHFMKKALKP